MKKKWYRSSAVKAAALVVGVASLTAAAAGGAASAGIMSEGVLPFDKKEYLESRSFEQSMRHASFDVLIAESEKSYMESKQENEEVDLWEILADEETDTEGSSGLVYRLGDLEKWVETENWDAHTEEVPVVTAIPRGRQPERQRRQRKRSAIQGNGQITRMLLFFRLDLRTPSLSPLGRELKNGRSCWKKNQAAP